MRGFGQKGRSQAARCFEWSGPYGEEFAPDKSASVWPCQAELLTVDREEYLAKECFGSNRLSKERLQLPAATTTETDHEEEQSIAQGMAKQQARKV